MSWIIGQSSDYIDLSNDIVTAVTGTSLQSIDSIAAAGTGYSAGDILTLSGGTFTITAQVEVVTVGGSGDVTAVRIYNAGSGYTSAPGDPVSTTGGGGSDCTLNCTFAANGWTAERDTAYSGSDREVILNGEGDGGDEIFVGWRTFSSGPGNYYNWELNGFTGYDSGLDTSQQPGISPGVFDGASANERAGSYLLLQNSTMDWYLSVTPYRIILMVKVGSAIMHTYLGWADRYAAESEHPYPLLISGMASAYNAQASASDLRSGLTDPWRTAGSEGQPQGPMFLRGTDGTWFEIRNAQISGSTKTTARDRVVIPTMTPDGAENASVSEQRDRFMLTDGQWSEFIPNSVASGNPTTNLNPTPGTADKYARVPCTIVFSDPAIQIYAELSDTYWVSAFGTPSSEDRFIDTDAFRVFQNGNRTEPYAHFAVREV